MKHPMSFSQSKILITINHDFLYIFLYCSNVFPWIFSKPTKSLRFNMLSGCVFNAAKAVSVLPHWRIMNITTSKIATRFHIQITASSFSHVFPIRLAMQWGTGPDFPTQLINTLVRKVFNNQHQPSNTHQHQWTPIYTHSSSINTNQHMFVHQSAPIFRQVNPNKTHQHHFHQWKAKGFHQS